jgi:hypothetical protein
LYGDKIKKHMMDMMGRTCGAYQGENYWVFWQKNLAERGHLENLSADMRVVIQWILQTQNRKVRKKHVIQDYRRLVSCEIGNAALRFTKHKKKKHHDCPTDY